jgi:hypothetical protein
MIRFLNQMNLVQIHITCFFIIHSNIILSNLFTSFIINNKAFLTMSCNSIGTVIQLIFKVCVDT